ncbi:MAG TPA: hypothetical protein EYN66_23385 [Myxococcales bacterium]|nr:hypothetical protein [Myxococcales bacterium]
MRVLCAGLILWMCLVAGCSGEQPEASQKAVSDEAMLAPNSVIRSALSPKAPTPEAGPLVPTKERRFGYDGHNRLMAAAGLVSGFEVPVGLKPIKRHSSLLVFEMTAPIEDIIEFYTGTDRETRRRFTARRYAVTDLERGLEIHHSASSLKRLKLSDQQLQSNIFIVAGSGRTHIFKFHTVPTESPEKSAKRFLNPINKLKPRKIYFDSKTDNADAPAKSSADSDAKKNDSQPNSKPSQALDSKPAYGGAYAPSSPGALPPVKQRARHGVQGKSPYWKHASSAERDASDNVRDWLERNPGETFYD